jgi:hypothetical protein
VLVCHETSVSLASTPAEATDKPPFLASPHPLQVQCVPSPGIADNSKLPPQLPPKMTLHQNSSKSGLLRLLRKDDHPYHRKPPTRFPKPPLLETMAPDNQHSRMPSSVSESTTPHAGHFLTWWMIHSLRIGRVSVTLPPGAHLA